MDCIAWLRPQRAKEPRCAVVNSVRASFLFYTQPVAQPVAAFARMRTTPPNHLAAGLRPARTNQEANRSTPCNPPIRRSRLSEKNPPKKKCPENRATLGLPPADRSAYFARSAQIANITHPTISATPPNGVIIPIRFHSEGTNVSTFNEPLKRMIPTRNIQGATRQARESRC